MSAIASEPIYAEIGESSSSRSSKLLRKNAIRISRDGRKPPLPPVREVPDGLLHKYATTNKKVSKAAVITHVEDGTSISDDLETDTRSSMLHRHRHQQHSSKMTSTLGPTRGKNSKQSTRAKLQFVDAKVSSNTLRPSEATDSGIFPSTSDCGNSDEGEIMHFTGLDKQDMLDLPIRLHQLINMYQRKLLENDELIKSREAEVNELRENRRIMEDENDELKLAVNELRNGYPTNIEEWRLLREQAELVLEENDDLHSQLKLLQSKLRENHVAHKKQVLELMQKLDITQDQSALDEAELKQLRVRFEKLREEYNLLMLKSRDQMPKEDHSLSVRESKKLLDDLKSRYEIDVEKANDLIKRLQTDKTTLNNKLAALSSENEQLSMENGVLIAMHKKDLNTMRHLRKNLSKYKSETLSLKFKLKSLQNQFHVLGKERNKLAITASTACEEVNRLLWQIENAASHEAKIRHLLANKISLLDELQHLISRTKIEKDEQHNLNETKRRLRKLREKADKN